MDRPDKLSADPELANDLFIWLTEHLDVSFTMPWRPAYEIRVNGYAVKARLQLMNRDKRNLARFCLILGTLIGIGIGWSLPW